MPGWLDRTWILSHLDHNLNLSSPLIGYENLGKSHVLCETKYITTAINNNNKIHQENRVFLKLNVRLLVGRVRADECGIQGSLDFLFS